MEELDDFELSEREIRRPKILRNLMGEERVALSDDEVELLNRVQGNNYNRLPEPDARACLFRQYVQESKLTDDPECEECYMSKRIEPVPGCGFIPKSRILE